MSSKPTSGPELFDSLALDHPGADAAEPWPTSQSGRGVRVRLPVAAGVVAAVALLGVWGGAILQGDSASAGITAERGPGGPNAARFPAGQAPDDTSGFPGGRGAGGITGEITAVEGETITLVDTQGNEVTVTISSDTTFTENIDASVSDIEPGTTISVRGTTTDGATAAQAVTINPGDGGVFPGGQFPEGEFPGGGQFPGADNPGATS